MSDWDPEKEPAEQVRPDILKTRTSIAKSLRTVEELALDLHAQALASPNARDFPGGDALHMLAPAAVLQDWEAEFERKEDEANNDDRIRFDGWHNPAVYQGDDNEHPMNVLCFWTRAIREDREQPTALTPTISREVDYLRGQVDWACRVDTYGDPEWPMCFEMAKELRMLVRRMEDVLHDGARPTFGVPCLYCGNKLMRRESKLLGLLDQYECTNHECGKEYTKDQYHRAVEQSHLLNAGELNAEQMEHRTGVRASKVRVWGVRYDGIKHGGRKDPEGRLLYVVEAVEAKRDELVKAS